MPSEPSAPSPATPAARGAGCASAPGDGVPADGAPDGPAAAPAHALLAEAALAQAALAQAALAQLTEGVIVTDAAGRITFVNDAAARLHGVARLDVAPDAYAAAYRLLTDDGAPYPSTDLPLARAALRGETVEGATWRIRRPDGTEVHAVGSARPVLGPDGAQVGAVLTVRDVTADHAATDALREANANLGAALGDAVRARRAADAARADADAERARAAGILEGMADAYFALDADFRLTAVNAAMTQGSGLARDQLLGRVFWDVFPGAVGTAFEQHYRAAVSERVAAHFAHDYSDGRLDIVVEVDAYPAPGGGMAAFWRDVTSRVRHAAERERLLAAERAARAQAEGERARVAAVLASIADAFYLLDRDWRFTHVNAAAEPLLQTTAAALLGRTLWEAFPDVAGSVFEGPYREAMATGRPTAVEAEFAPLGTWFDVRSYPWAGGLMVHFRDVGARHAAEAERERLLAEGARGRAALAAANAELVGANAQLQEAGLELELSNQQLQEQAAELEAQAEELQATAAHLEEQTEAADRARRAAEAARTRLHTVLAQAPAAVVATEGPDHRFVLVNARAEALLGRRDLLGRAFAEALPDVAAQGYAALLDRVYATGEPVVAQGAPGQVARPDGTVVAAHYDFVYQPLRDADGRVTGILQHAVDVTDQVRARDALAASEAKYRSLFEAMDQGFCLTEVLVDAEGRPVDYRFLEVNPVFARQTGLADAVGRTARELVPGLEQHWVDLYGRVALTGETARFQQGSEAMGRWFDGFAFRVGDPADRRVAILFTDVSAAKAAAAERERLLAETEAARAAADLERWRLLATLEQLPVGVHIAEAPGGRLLLGNAAVRRIWGGAPASAGVADYSADYVGLHRAGPRAGQPVASDEWPMARALATGAPVPDEVIEAARADGTRALVSVSAAPVRDGDGRVVGAVATSLDVTERERLLGESEAARARAVEANAAKAQFLANMSHELRTPLNAIGGYAQLLDMGLHGPVTEEQRAALARVHAAQHRLLSLINDILNYAKLESGRVEYDVAAVDVREVVAEVAPLVEPQLRARGLVFDVRLPEAPCAVWADREKLGQVLVNLLSNAVKFTAPVHPATGAPGRVTVRVAVRTAGPDGGRPGLVFVRVGDTGVGIPRDKQDSIFEPFVQVRTRESSYAQATEGTGLGLAISRDLARGMGGDLRVRSAPGAGSTFTVALRRVLDAAGRPVDRRTGDERRDDHERRSRGDRREVAGGDGLRTLDPERTGRSAP